MMNLEYAIAYGKNFGVNYYVMNSNGRVVGGTRTHEDAVKMMKDFEKEDRSNPWTKGQTRFYIKEIK